MITISDLLIDNGFDADVVNKMKAEEVIMADSIDDWYEKELYMAKITEKYGGTMYTDQRTVDYYNLLRKQFDIVVYIIQEAFHIRCTNAFWKGVLQTYLINRVFCDTEVTEYSLPCTFALRALQQHSCLGQQFEVNSEVFQAISKHPCVAWADVMNDGYKMLKNNGNYLKLVFRLTNHQQKAVEGKELKESLIFCIDDNISLKTVYEKKIEFDETYFTNILNSEKGKNVWDQDLLDIAAELMPPLI